MARVEIVKPDTIEDPAIQGIFDWVTEKEGSVPNHFYIEMNFPEFFPAKLGATKVLWEAGELSMEEIQHIGILVSKANGCAYCTAAFCTILTYGLGSADEYVKTLVSEGTTAVEDSRLTTLLDFALKVNADPASTSDEDITGLREAGLTDKGIVQIIHVVSDFASYNRLNLALQTDYDYRDIWRTLAG